MERYVVNWEMQMYELLDLWTRKRFWIVSCYLKHLPLEDLFPFNTVFAEEDHSYNQDKTSRNTSDEDNDSDDRRWTGSRTRITIVLDRKQIRS